MIRLAAALLTLIAFLVAPAGAADEPAFPPLTGRVVDQASVIGATAAERLDALLAAHERKTGQQVVVATVKSLGGNTIEDYGYQLGRHWGIGQKDKDNGVILLVAPNDRKVRIEIGYGLEGDLTDADSSFIIQRLILPHFRSGDIQGGVVAGTEGILRALGDDLSGAPAPQRAEPEPQGSGVGSIIFVILMFLFFVWAFRRQRGGAGSFIWPYLIMSSFGGRGGSWGSGGGFSGGGGGFSGGGGSFGGGGASGSW